MDKKIKITICPDGSVQAEIEGIKGKKCRNYIKLIEEITGARTVDSEKTKEYDEKPLINIIDPVIENKGE